MVNLNFTVVGTPGMVSPVSFNSFQYNEGPPCGTPNNGSVTVISGTITGKVTYGNIVQAPVTRYVPNVAIVASGNPSVATTTVPGLPYSLSNFGPGAYTINPSKTGGVNVKSTVPLALSRTRSRR